IKCLTADAMAVYHHREAFPVPRSKEAEYMPKTPAVRISVIALLVCVAIGSSLSAAPFDPNQPPELKIPSGDLTSEAVRRQRATIQNWVKHWAKVLETDQREALLLKARQSLSDGYTKYDSVERISSRYYRIYADAVAENVAPLLEKTGTLRQINVALVLASTPRISMQDHYETMVTHDNPGVRFLGWRGFSRIRDTILAQGSRSVDKFFNVAAKVAPKESSPELLSSLLRAMRVVRTVTNSVTVPDDVLASAQTRAFSVIHSTWDKQLAPIVKGNIEMSHTGRMGVRAIKAVWEGIKDNKTARTQALQDLVNLAHAATLATDKAEGTGPVASANLLLLRDAESALKSLSGKQGSYIGDALTDTDIDDPALRAKGAVLGALEWATQLKDDGVVKPVDPTKQDDEKDNE
ncbi:MAG: hypothetical protein ACLFVY_13745, partial [Phycisphaerae bacterium]